MHWSTSFLASSTHILTVCLETTRVKIFILDSNEITKLSDPDTVKGKKIVKFGFSWSGGAV